MDPLEREHITRKHFIADARLSLGSALLKRLFVSQSLHIPFSAITFARKGDPRHGKPAATLPNGAFAPVDFNVSHQAGLVTLVGWVPEHLRATRMNSAFTPTPRQPTASEALHVGVDIVCVHERDDYRTIDQEGFDGWVDIYEEIFSDAERWDMKFNIDELTLLDGTTLNGHDLGRADRCLRRDVELSAIDPNTGRQVTFSSDILLDAKLRRFYAFFCYKEAYIKLEGEALLAPWLKELELQNVRSPHPGTVPRCSTHGVWGGKVEDVEVHFRGKPVHDVKMAIQAYEENYMIATAVKGPKLPVVPAFTRLDLENDVMIQARKG